MLDTLSADQFNALIGTKFTVVVVNGPDIEITLEQVKEKPEAKDQTKGEDVRTPFALFFKGDATFGFELGTYDLVHPDFPDGIRDIYLTRVIPPETETPEAWYQATFC
ncbi:DUF6916 family protein [Pseudomonadota bacterium]